MIFTDSHCHLTMSDADGSLTFEVTDDGVGFDTSVTGCGTGLQGMEDRLDAGGGSLEVRSTPDHGTTVAGRVFGLQGRT